MKLKIWLTIVVVFCIVSRTYGADLFPAALTHDEVVYAAQAMSYAAVGQSTNGQSSFFDLKPAHPMYAELPAKLMAPFFMILNNPLLATRSLSILMGILLPFAFGWLSYGLWKNKQLAFVVTTLAVLNPLLWQMSRLAYDAVFSTFFYVLGGAILLNCKGKKVFWSVLFLLLGFFEYQGYKLIFLPWILFLATKAKNRYQFISLLIGIFVFLVYLFGVLPHQQVGGRWNQTIFSATSYQSEMTNFERRISLDNPLKSLFSNKHVAVAKYLTVKFFDAYSLQSLFLSGEPARSKFAVWGHGWFYYIDALLIVLGVGYVATQPRGRKTAVLLGLFMIASTIPATLNFGESWNLLRMFFPNMLLILFASWGVLLIGQNRSLSVLLLGTYALLVMNFAYLFYYRYPIFGTNTSYLSERVVAEYLVRSKKINSNAQFVVYTVDPPVMFWTYLIYGHRISKETQAIIALAEKTENYTIDGITFSGRCVDVTQGKTVLTESWRGMCEKTQTMQPIVSDSDYDLFVKTKVDAGITIPSIIDNGAYWRVYDNTLCNPKTLNGFVGVRTLNDFSFSSQSDEVFCTRWFSDVSI